MAPKGGNTLEELSERWVHCLPRMPRADHAESSTLIDVSEVWIGAGDLWNDLTDTTRLGRPLRVQTRHPAKADA